MTNIEKPWCVVVKLDGVFAIRSFKTRREMREDYRTLKKYGYKCKTFRQILDDKNKIVDTSHYKVVS